jgi:hypothetical protein
MEQMQYNLLFRWFVGLGVDDRVWVATVFSKNRDRLLTTDIAQKFLAAILAHREIAPLLSDEHFSVDGTLIKAWASAKSFQPKPEQEAAGSGGGGPDDPPAPPPAAEAEPTETKPETAPMSSPKLRSRNAEVDFRGEKRSNATHASVTDPQARLYRKSPGVGALLCFMGHALMENRNGFVVQAEVTQADGHAERKAALNMVHRHSPGSTRRLTACGAKGEVLRNRRPDHPARGLRPLAALPEKDRGALRLGQDRRADGANHAARREACRRPVHLHDGRLQPCPVAEAARCMRRRVPDKNAIPRARNNLRPPAHRGTTFRTAD